MKRNEVIQKLIKEGFSQNTLVNMSDKQISMISERVLGEQPVVTQNVQQTTIDTTTPEGKKVAASLLNDPKSIKGKYEVKEVEKSNGEKRKEQVKQGAYDGRFKTKVVKDKKKEESKTLARKKVEMSEEKPLVKEPKKKKIEKKSLNLKKLEDLDKKEIKEWIENLIENDYHPLTTKDEIMELVKQKLNEGPEPLVADPDTDVEPDIDVEPDVDSPVKPDTDPFVDPWDNPGEGPDPRPKFQGEKGMPEFLKFKEILKSINEKKDIESLSESIMKEIKKYLSNG